MYIGGGLNTIGIRASAEVLYGKICYYIMRTVLRLSIGKWKRNVYFILKKIRPFYYCRDKNIVVRNNDGLLYHVRLKANDIYIVSDTFEERSLQIFTPKEGDVIIDVDSSVRRVVNFHQIGRPLIYISMK